MSLHKQKAELEIIDSFDEREMEIEHRIRNLCWTISDDYELKIKPDVKAFKKSKYIAFYDAIKQGAFAKYFDKDVLSMYLVKKMYFGAGEQSLTAVAQLCVEGAVADRIIKERKGVQEIQTKAFEAMLEYDFSIMASSFLGQVKICLMQQRIAADGILSKRIKEVLDEIDSLKNATQMREILEVIDRIYNRVIDPHFEKKYGDLDAVLSVTLEDLKEFNWQDFLEEELGEEQLESYMERMANTVTNLEEKEKEKTKPSQMKRMIITPEAAAKMYSYIELNYGRSYLSEQEQKRVNYALCRGAHADCSLYYTEGILSNMVRKNYQSEYARRAYSENLRVYRSHRQVTKSNIEQLSSTLKRALVARTEREVIHGDYGRVRANQLWKVGRSRTKNLFEREQRKYASDFVVYVLIDASGSQRSRQSFVALQGYILSESLSQIGLPHQVCGFCTFWDYTILHRFRKYEDHREENKKIFEFHSSSNNRDGLAIRAAAHSLKEREEENKILIVLSDGRPNDMIVNRPNSKNPATYAGEYAISDTATEVRKTRAEGISVLGVFAGEEQDLLAERKIFGKDFAYIRDVMNFSDVVGRYLKKQLEDTGI